jgi:hypothetical protein
MDILTQPEPDQVSPGTGQVLVSIGGAGPERTLVPSGTAALVFTRYDLSFEGPAPVGPVSVTENLALGVSVELPVGWWTIRATGYTGTAGDCTPAAEGSVEVTVNEGANPSVTITLGPLTAAGNGTFSYSVSVIPEGATGSLIISPAEGGPDQTIVLNGGSSYEDSLELPGGQYLVRVALENDGKYAGLTEVLHLYPGKAIELPAQIYTITDFTEPVTELDLSAYFTAPAKDEVPQTTLETSQYTGTIAWTINASTPLNSNFATGNAYRATVTLTPKPGYTFVGVAQNSFEYNGFAHAGTPQIANDAGSNVVNFRFAALTTTGDDATLRALTVRRGNDSGSANLTLTPAFEGNITEYSVVFEKDTADSTVNQIQISGTTRNASATKAGELTSWTPVSEGSTAYSLTVTAADGTTTKTYTITVTMLTLTADGKNADLSSLAVDSGTLSPPFDPAVTAYTLTVFSPSITVRGTAEKAGIGATVSANSGAPQNLYLGQNTIPIVVTASGGLDTKTYTVTVTRKAPDPLLSGLTVDQGILSPEFSSGRTAYTVDVPYSVGLITVTGAAKAALDGAAVSANSGVSQNLSVGPNAIDIVVTAADGTTTKTYTVTVTRAAQNRDATLASLSVSAGTLVPLFDPGVTSYGLTVPNAVGTITVTGAAAQAGAAVSANSGQAQNLSEGVNAIDIVVTAADTTTTKTYTVTVTRLESEYIEIDDETELVSIGNDGAYPLTGKYLLMKDLTLSDWTPIAPDATRAFSGSFDGNGKTITINSFSTGALSSAYLGIFGYVNGASFANLKVQSGLSFLTGSASATTHVGLLAAYANDTTLEGITASGTLDFTTNRTLYAGGIIGYHTSAGTVLTAANSVTNSVSSVNVKGAVTGSNLAAFAGGINGYAKALTASNCSSSGAVTAIGTGYNTSSGGISGEGAYSSYTDCHSSGAIYIGGTGGMPYAGGIVGRAGSLGTTGGSTITRCYASGTIETLPDATGAYPYLGGIVGYLHGGSVVSECYATGDITHKGSGASSYLGGIGGICSGGGKIENCYASGNVTNKAGRTGGITGGYGASNAIVQYCYATGAVAATSGSAGITGTSTTSLTTKNCVALNISITITNASGSPRRVSGDGVVENNIGWSAMPLANGSGPVRPSAATANGADGADTIAKPGKAIYQSLCWDFDTVWKMGGDGYPVLQWQD